MAGEWVTSWAYHCANAAQDKAKAPRTLGSNGKLDKGFINVAATQTNEREWQACAEGVLQG